MATLPALTTTFSPPAPCKTPFLSDDGMYWLAPRITLPGTSLIQCLPYSNVDFLAGGNVFTYSPGLYCPLGWTTAGTAPVPDTVPAYACCPRDFDFDSTMLCTESIKSGRVYVGDASNQSNVLVTVSVTDTITVTSEGIVTFGAIVLMGQSEKTSNTSPTKSSALSSQTSSSPTSTETSISQSSQAATSSAPANASTESKSLSTGAKAGIAVGVVAAVVLILVAAFYCFRNYRKNKLLQTSARLQGAEEAASHGQPEDKNQGAYGYGFKPELDATGPPRFELDATTVKSSELDGISSERAELSAAQRARELEGPIVSKELDAGGELRR
ncbi:hypothetical protein F5Y18DRAFT_315535 [Xylariaceae sp. FL1019]|nr:hypothetical protein F5Y18DRAFT_315535 [Xylariaceae sp. FL1019]